MSEDQKPLERRHMLAIKVGGDSQEDIIYLLRAWLNEFEEEGLFTSTVGGHSAGGSVVYAENPEINHESYFDLVDEWMEARRKKDEEETSA